tara:strand:- start:196 stop:609 length:414 start_codon:yes stop_codon:yes gene_type:complete
MVSSAMGIWNYWIVFILMMIGLFIVIGRKNFLKKIVGLTIFQTSVFLLYITFGKITGGIAPILTDSSSSIYSNPLPHVLILTAIVVGVATTALGLALVVRINSTYGSIEEDDISAQDLVDYHDQNQTFDKINMKLNK